MPSSKGSPAEGNLGDLFLRTSRVVRHRWIHALAPWEVSPHQARALRLIGDLEPVRPGVLADHLRIAARSVTDVADSLEERGYVSRGPDPDDRRATVLRLTPSGRKVRTAIDDSRREEAEDYFARLSERDRAALARILRRLDEDPGQPGPRGG